VLRGQGMPSYRHHEMGDMYVTLSVAFPETLPLDKLALLEQVLPARRALPKLKNEADVEDVLMDDVDEREARNAKGSHQHGNGMDTDEDDGEGGPGVQCAQQ